MCDRNTEGTSDDAPAYDAETLADLEGLFGHARLMEMLSGLAREIDARLGSDAADTERLGRDAHALISVSGALGFMPLSLACVELEKACLGDGNVEAARQDALRSAASACRAIASLRNAGET